MPQRPSDRSNAAMAAWPSKKLSVRRSTTRRAVCSLPIAKVARLVLGVREVIKGPGNRCGRKCVVLQIHYPVTGWRNNPACPMASQIPQATGDSISAYTVQHVVSRKNPTRKMRCGRVFTACEPETQGLFTALYTETCPVFSHACCHVFHEPADRVFTACEHRTQWVVHSVMHRSVPGFVTGLSPAFARAWQSLRVVRRTRSWMTAPPWSYDLRLHQLISDFS